MTLSVSLTRILEGVYAHSAFMALYEREKSADSLLTRCHETMLRRMAVDVFLELAVSMAGYIVDVDVDDGDILTMDLAECYEATPVRMAGAYLEACVTRLLMARAWQVSGHDVLAQSMDSAATLAREQLCRLCQEYRELPGRIVPE